LKFYCRKSEKIINGHALFLNGAVNLDLPHVGVAAVLVVTSHGNLNHEHSNWLVSDVFYGDVDPPRRLCQHDNFDLLQIVKMAPHPDRDATGGVALIQLVIRVNVNVADRGFSLELNVDEVGQLSVGLPVRVITVISQLVDSKP
jgi:hypothetical protein